MSSTRTYPPAANQERYALLEEQATRIQNHIHQLQLQLADIRARQNALVPVSRMPDDVLWEVFAHLVQPHDYRRGRRCKLITASHVSGRWRRVAIDNPALWTEVPLHTLERAALFLERSHPLPVRIYFDRQIRPDRQASRRLYSQLVVSQIPRLRALSLHHLNPEKEAMWWMGQLGAAAPALEELSLIVDDEDVHCGDLSVFDGKTPSLRKLSLHRILFPSSSPLYQHLRYLSISTLALKTLSVPELLEILRRAVGLETLALEGIFVVKHADAEGAPPPQDHAPVTLARLSTLEATRIPPAKFHSILQHLTLPASTRINIDMGYSMHHPDVVFPRNPSTLPSLTGLRALETVFGASPIDGVPFTLRGKRDMAEDAPWGLSLHARAYRQAPIVILDMHAVVSYKMTVEGKPERGNIYEDSYKQPWEPMLREMAALQTLYVQGHEYFLRYAKLFRVLAAHAGTPPRPATCPSLEELEIVQAHCDEAFWDGLLEMLRNRRNSGCPLRSVRLKEVTGVVDVVAPVVLEARAVLEDLQLSAAGAGDVPL